MTTLNLGYLATFRLVIQRGSFSAAADVLGMLLIYCDGAGIDLEAAMRRKWLKWLETT